MPNIIRLIVFSLTFAFAVIGLAAGANSFAKSNSQKDFVKTHSPIPGVTVDTHDLFAVGVVLIVGCGGLILTSLVALLTTFVHLNFFTRTLEALVFAFWALWIFACDIANTVVSRTRSAKILAGGVELPPGLVQSASQQLGVSPRYWSNSYVRFYAIVTWITFLFAVLSAFVSLFSRSKRNEAKA